MKGFRNMLVLRGSATSIHDAVDFFVSEIKKKPYFNAYPYFDTSEKG
jgi:hypothetical protein